MNLEIRTTLDTVLASQTDLPIQSENTHYKPTMLEPWIRTTLLPSESTVMTLGANPSVDVNGIYQVDIFYPAGSSTININTLTNQLVKYFYANRRLPIDNSSDVVQITTIWETVATTDPDWYNAGFALRYSQITKT